MRTSEKTEAISEALAKAQAKLKNPKYDCTNPHFKSKYASLAAIRDAVMPTLAEHGLSLTQEVGFHEHGIGVTTTLWHSSGQFMESAPIVIPVERDQPQGVVAASTYGRRVGMSSFLCVVGDDDSDGNDVPKPAARAEKRQEAQQAAPAAGEPSFLDKVAVALQATKSVEAADAVWKAALDKARERGSSANEVERLRPLLSLQAGRIALGADFDRLLGLHGGNAGMPWFGLGGDARNKLAEDVLHRLEKGT